MSRRGLLQASLLGGVLAGCSTAPGGSSFDAGPPLVPIRARTDRIFDIAVCLRPFRPAGPRVDTERLGDTLVVHNYGHGGSGWSLSWGSSARAVRLAMQSSPGEVAVIGCGVLGLTSAILAQRAGAPVEWIDQYSVADDAARSRPSGAASGGQGAPPAVDFASYSRRIADLTPK